MLELPQKTVHVTQGQFAVSADPEAELVTILGSCVAVCLHDPVAGMGGMNHFLLPGADPEDRQCIKYGAHSMEQLINALLRMGAGRHRIEARLFGGANLVAGLGRIGARNLGFARDYVLRERFALKGEDGGGCFGRKLRFRPATGACQLRVLNADLPELRQRETRLAPPPVPETSVDLF